MSSALASASAPAPERGPVEMSVLIPVRNEERHIRETVAAMQAQRFEGSLELLFADGRSSDRTREILEGLAAADPRIRILDNPRRHTASGLDTGVFGGVWRRSTLLAAGGWDERWPINQDSEMAARFLDRGARLVCVAEMRGHYVPRDSLASLARQHFRYGFYRARTFRRHPRSMRLSHLLAPGLAVAAVCALAGPRRARGLGRVGLGVYVASLGASAAGARGAGA